MTARSDESNRGPAIACAILKRARGEWATALELADEAQCAPRIRGHKRTERNAAILRQYTSGMRVSDIAVAHGISASRVDQLIRDSGTPRREKKPEKRAKPSSPSRSGKPQGPQITPEGFRLTICPSTPDHRYTVREVTEPMFSALGIGRYLDRDTATQRRLA